MRICAGLLVAAVLTLAAPALAAPTGIRARVYLPTCKDRAFAVEILNRTDRTVRISTAVWNPKRRVRTWFMEPGAFGGVRIPVFFVGPQRGWTLTVVRGTWAHFRRTGKGWLADGFFHFEPGRCQRFR